jgi:hypothetical protein
MLSHSADPLQLLTGDRAPIHGLMCFSGARAHVDAIIE